MDDLLNIEGFTKPKEIERITYLPTWPNFKKVMRARTDDRGKPYTKGHIYQKWREFKKDLKSGALVLAKIDNEFLIARSNSSEQPARAT